MSDKKMAEVEMDDQSMMLSGDHTNMESHIQKDLMYHSWVDPQEANPNLTWYDKDLTFTRPSFRDLEFKLEEVDTEVANAKLESNAPLPGPNPDSAESRPDRLVKFGTWDGVFTSCLLNIFGVIMFLRLGWVVGQAGIFLAVFIVLLSTVVTTLTAQSMSAICTNGEVGAGGAYYLISRSIGPEVGGAVGVLFSLGQAVAVALYIIGFCETFVTQMGTENSITGDVLNDTRIYGLILLTIIFIMALIGVGWVIKLQIGLLVLLIASIASFMIGTTYQKDVSKGIEGYGTGLFSANFGPDYRPEDGIDYDFFKTFSVFFPAVTGVMAGANISGDLVNPSKNIPKGTLWAIGISTVTYIIMAIMIGSVVARDVDGDLDAGLYNDKLVMVKVSFWGPLVLAGIYAATFSSALASIVGAPRILMSLAHDRLIPALNPFSVIRERDGSPVRGYYITFIVAALCVCIGELNLIAPLISMFFMMTYALINFSCFALSYTKSPGWRPSFKNYSTWGSLFGSALCIVAMFLTNIVYALGAICIGVGLYYYVLQREPAVNWGSASEARKEMNALKLLISLRHSKRHVKSFRPSYLVLSGDPSTRPHLVRFAHTLKKGFGATVYGNVTIGNYRQNVLEYREKHRDGYYVNTDWGVESFYDCIISETFRYGVSALIQLSGFGRLKPNTLIMGFKEDWSEAPDNEVKDYVGVLTDTLQMRMGVMVLRNIEHIDFDSPIERKGTVDIWWLVDDGGLTILIPYILSKHKFWKSHTEGEKKTTIRVFVVTDDLGKMQSDLHMVANMLQKFRLDWEAYTVPTEKKPPSAATVDAYEQMSRNSVDKQRRPEITRRWLRVSELIRARSSNAKLIFCTIPFPRTLTNAYDYMSWLDVISKDMPPMVLMRGNGKNVLTFYSE